VHPGDHGDGFDASPQVFSLKPVDVAGRHVTPGFDAAMIAVNGFDTVQGSIGGLLDEKGDIFMQVFLVVFNLDDVIGFFVR